MINDYDVGNDTSADDDNRVEKRTKMFLTIRESLAEILKIWCITRNSLDSSMDFKHIQWFNAMFHIAQMVPPVFHIWIGSFASIDISHKTCLT